MYIPIRIHAESDAKEASVALDIRYGVVGTVTRQVGGKGCVAVRNRIVQSSIALAILCVD